MIMIIYKVWLKRKYWISYFYSCSCLLWTQYFHYNDGILNREFRSTFHNQLTICRKWGKPLMQTGIHYVSNGALPWLGCGQAGKQPGVRLNTSIMITTSSPTPSGDYKSSLRNGNFHINLLMMLKIRWQTNILHLYRVWIRNAFDFLFLWGITCFLCLLLIFTSLV